MVVDGTVLTPDAGVAGGHHPPQRARAAANSAFRTRGPPVKAEEARNADEMFLSTTAGGVMPTSRIDGRIMNNDCPGPISAKINNRFWAKRAAGWHATPFDYEDLAP